MHTLLLFLHVLGAGLIVGIVFLSIVAVIKPPLDAIQLARLRWVGRFGVWASAWQLLTGVGLYLMERETFNGQRVFWAKIILYVIEGAFAAMVLERTMKRAQAGQPPASRSAVVTVLVVHAVLIVAIVALGVALAHTGS